jgi:uncharacterized protein (DUF1330 family)
MTNTTTPKPAYLISSLRVLRPERLGPFRQAAAPLTAGAGATSVAVGDPSLRVLEGTWNHEGSILVIERYPSMEGLLAMWNSPDFQAAKKLTVGLVDVNFTVAIEGR